MAASDSPEGVGVKAGPSATPGLQLCPRPQHWGQQGSRPENAGFLLCLGQVRVSPRGWQLPGAAVTCPACRHLLNDAGASVEGAVGGNEGVSVV